IAKHGHIVNPSHRVFIADYIDGLEREAQQHEYRLDLQQIHGFDRERVLRSFDADSVEGVVVLGTELEESDLEVFVNAPLPVVILDTIHPCLDLDFVDMDNASSINKVVRHFLEFGHTRIGLVASSTESENFRQRSLSFLETMRRSGLDVDPKQCFAIDSTYEKGLADMARLLDGAKELPTALFAVNDIIAYSCIQALKNKGISVPGDVSVIGFDNLPSDDFMEPRLTSIKVSNGHMGTRAMRLVLDRIADPSRAKEKVLVGGELVLRSSVRALGGPSSAENLTNRGDE
ncbi:MAG: substrate-binding domain-containing protein, partial [Bacillota bacterium]|nr:substrate-binding domain-containing protein [Bacillota bacterium]